MKLTAKDVMKEVCVSTLEVGSGWATSLGASLMLA